MNRWAQWCVAVWLSSAVVVHPVAAKESEALSAEGTIVTVDVSSQKPTIVVRLSTGQTRTFSLERIGAWESLTADSVIKFRYTAQPGRDRIESIEITSPIQPAASASATPSPSPTASPNEQADKGEKKEPKDDKGKKP